MIKRIVPFALVGLIALSQTSCKSNHYKKTAGGIEYQIIKDEQGKKVELGDQLDVHITLRLTDRKGAKDTVMLSSRQVNKNQPFPFLLEAPKFNGDIAEGLALMTPGDSAVFRIKVDSLLKAGGQLLPYMKAGMVLEYDVVLVAAKSNAQAMQEAQTKATEQKGTDDKLLQEYLTQNNIKAEKTASGLYYEITTPGKGEPAKPGQTVSVMYIGKTMDGQTFDANMGPDAKHTEAFEFIIGQRQVIPGWDEGIALLNKGAKAKLYIPSHLAYGAQSPSPQIPPNSILIFEVELVNIK